MKQEYIFRSAVRPPVIGTPQTARTIIR